MIGHMMNKWIIYVVIVSLTAASGKCDNPDRNTTGASNHILTTLKQLGEYHDITTKITDTSCTLSNTSNLEEQSSSSAASWISTNYNKIVHSFSATCRRYTDTLAFKYQLQKVIFNKNEALNSDAVLKITLLIINLQTAAMKLQQIELKLDEKYCATFSPKQYELIYFSRLHKDNTISSLCEKAKIWQDRNNVCTRWSQYK